MPTVSFEGDASGAIAAAQAAQGAIDAVHGKTVTVDVQFKQAGGGGAADVASDLGRAAGAAERAGRAARGMSDDFQRAGTRMAGMATGAGRTAAGMRETADHAERMNRAVASIGGMRQVNAGAIEAGRQMKALESGANRTAVAVRNIVPSGSGGIAGGALSDAVIDVQKLEDGTWGVGKAMRAITAGSGPKPFSWAGVRPGDIGSTFGVGARAKAAAGGIPPGAFDPRSGSYSTDEGIAAAAAQRKAERDARTAGRSPVAERLAAARAAKAVGEGEEEAGKSAQRTSGHVMTLSRALGTVTNSIWPMMAISGAMAGAASASMNLMNSTTGMGLNFKGMTAGITEAEQSAARAHNLGLNGLDQSLRQSARSMVGDLVPAMRAGVAATKAFEQAGMRSQAAMGPDLENFANHLARNAPAIQGEMGAMKGAALSVGAAMADAYGSPQAQQAIGGFAQGVRSAAPKVFGAMDSLMSYAAGTYDPVGSLKRAFTPAPKVAPGGFDSSKPFTGQLPDGTIGAGDTSRPAPREAFSGGPRPVPPQYAGMSAPQIYESQYRAATGYASTGVGRPSEYGAGFTAPSPAGASAADTGAALTKHVQKAVNIAAPAAEAGGSQLGAQMTAGMAAGITTTQTVTDTVMIKHLKHVQDIAAGSGGIDAHSPSEKYRRLFRYVPEGMALGIRDGMYHPTAAMADTFAQMQADSSLAADQADLDQARTPVTVSASRNLSARQYSDQVMDRIQAHNDRAQQLARNRADLHEAALARAGVAGHTNPFAADRNPFAKAAEPSWWQKLNSTGPQDTLHNMFSKAGQASTAGLTAGIMVGLPAVHAAGGQASVAGVSGYKKKDRQSSPSAEWAGLGANSVAGVPIGFSAGVPAAVSAMSDAAGQMSMALAGPLSDYGLKAGDTFAQSLIDGSSREIRAASYGALGEPGNLNPDAMANLTGTGLLRAGSGASALKTPSGGPSVVVLPPAMPSTIVVQLQGAAVQLDGNQVGTIMDQRIELALDAATNTYQML